MESSASYFCSLCQEDDETSTAVTWCAECEVFLCPECQKHHGRSKMSRNHLVMSLHDYQNLPEFILKIKNNCKDHDQRYELFCSFHDAACCVKCIKDKHDNCKGLVPLGEVVGNIKSSAHVSQVEKNLIDLLGNLKSIKNFFSDNLASLQKQKTEAVGKVHKMRQSINEHLDKLEKCLLNDIESEFTKTRDIIGGLKIEIERKSEQIEQKQKDFSNMVEFSTDLQTYFGLHEVEKITKEEEKYIINLKSADNLRKKIMEVNLSLDLESSLKEVTALGKAAIYLSPDNLQLKTKGEGQVQSQQNLFLSQINPTIKQTFKIPKRSAIISSCQILPRGDVLFVDRSNKCLLLFNDAGEFVRTVVITENKPSDVCYLTQSKVIVTDSKRNLLLIDVEKNQIVKQKHVENIGGNIVYGICTYEQTIYVRVVPKSVLVLEFDFHIKYQLKIVGTTLTRIAVFRDKLYCTDWTKNKVLCYNKTGELLWSFNQGAICPLGIDVDRNGFVYVACQSSNKIIALSQDGKESKIILSAESGVKQPFAINVNRESSLLCV